MRGMVIGISDVHTCEFLRDYVDHNPHSGATLEVPTHR
jgi:hypothetical protein